MRVETQIVNFYDTNGTGAFFATPFNAAHTILRLKDGMDTSEPSTNGTSASNLYRLSSLLNDDSYSTIAKETVAGFESEMLQYPWLFASFMPSIVASKLGVRGIVVAQGEEKDEKGILKVKEFEQAPRGGLGSFAKLYKETTWLRHRNSLLKDFGKDGRTRILICDGGKCIEEGVLQDIPQQNEKEPLDVSRVAAALPVVEESKPVPVPVENVLTPTTSSTVPITSTESQVHQEPAPILVQENFKPDIDPLV
jgi:uncharacterized protein YyaL (SSP411 family)